MKLSCLLLAFLLPFAAFSQAANFPRVANTAADLGVLPIPGARPNAALTALVIGVNTLADGNGGLFYWNYDSTDVPDGQNVFLNTNAIYSVNGRWIRFPLIAPTPGQVSTPVFSPADSSFTTPISVTIDRKSVV